MQLSAKTRLRAAICSRNPSGALFAGAVSQLIDEQAYLVMMTGGSIDPMGMPMRDFI
jgi:hypothetical protein